MADEGLSGRLIVATPLIGDPNFERTVILVLAHDDSGAFGVVLNRPSATGAEELLPEWSAVAAEPDVVFVGGPVGRNAVLGVVEHPERAGVDRFETVDLNRSPWDRADDPGAVRLFAGSAGWGVGQLEEELADRAWWVVEAEAGDVITAEPEQLWRTVLRRQPGVVGWHANWPAEGPLAN
ncbi:MAG: YqgE/AlgH family protein [Actinobacteria bacterium]|nr:YqgE/AlgH family protein [Actinomycetota bacterium]